MVAMMVEVTDADVQTKSGTSAKTGRAYSIREQQGWLHLPGEPYPQKIKLNLEEGDSPYTVGRYQLLTSSFYVGRFGDLQVRVRLDRSKRADLKAA